MKTNLCQLEQDLMKGCRSAKRTKDYFEKARHVYADAIDAFTKLDSEVYKEAKKEVRLKRGK